MARLTTGQPRKRSDVLFYAPALGPLVAYETEATAGGAETQIYLVARALASRGLRTALLVFELPDAKLPDEVDGVGVIVRPRYRGGAGARGRLHESVAIARALLKVDAATIVVRAAGPAAGIVGLVAKARRRRFVYSASSDLDFGLAEPRAVNRFLIRLALRLADRVVVQNDRQAAVCERFARRAPLVVRSIAEPAAASREQRSEFLWIGRAVSYKQPMLYVELARAVPEARFVMVLAALGSRPSEDLSSAVREAAAGIANLEILPPVRRDELLPLFDRAVAIVNTSEFEGMPNTFLEGWARGVPALVYSYDPDGVVAREGLGASGAGDWGTFVMAARALWRNRGDQGALACRCREHVIRNHSADEVVSAWESAVGLIPVPASMRDLAGVA